METVAEHLMNAQTVSDTPQAESRKTAMASSKPFWTLRVHDKRDVLVARHKARQIAHLLHFPPLEEACIAAGAFAVAAQARDHYEICDLCFQMDQHQLVVWARPIDADAQQAPAAAGLMKLAKNLPVDARGYAVDELAFLIGRINEQAPADLFGELSKQNQEILLLLHMVNHPEEQLSQKSTSAA